MEQLEPILRYKFWISFAAAILLPAVGWYMATGTMSAEVNKRLTMVNGKFNDKILKESEVAKIPNDKYIEGLKAINAVHAKDLQQAKDDLCNAQKQYMVWPDIVSETMASAGYRQAPADPDAKFKYGNVYRLELERVRKIVNPFDKQTKEGFVYAPEGVLPKAQDDNWTTYGPPVDRMWDAQEDVWLLTSIMQAIAAVNKDATSIIDAPVKAIQEVSLRGGSKVAPRPAAAQTLKARPGPAAARSFGTATASPGDVNFNPTEEFGPEVVVAAAGPATKPGDEEEDKSRRNRKNAKAIKKAGKKGDDSSSAPTNAMRRYIEDDPSKGYKTRGFYIRVAMDHTFVPELVSQLSNMPWPTAIARVQQSDEVTKIYNEGRVENSAAAVAAASPAGAGAQPAAGHVRGGIDFQGLDLLGQGRRDQEKEDQEKQEVEEQKKKLLESPKKAAGLAGQALEKDLVNAALEDPYVGLVVIAGTMTIYNQPVAKNPQQAQQPAPSKPADAEQDDEQPDAASPPAKQGNATPQQPNKGGEAPSPDKAQQKPATPPKSGNQQPAQNNPPPKQANPPTNQPKQGGSAASPPAKQPATESKAGPTDQSAGKKPQPDAPAKPPNPAAKK